MARRHRALGNLERAAGGDRAEYSCPEAIVENEMPRDQMAVRQEIHRLKKQGDKYRGDRSAGEPELHPVDLGESSSVVGDADDGGEEGAGNETDDAEARGKAKPVVPGDGVGHDADEA